MNNLSGQQQRQEGFFYTLMMDKAIQQGAHQ
jgi:hypothetical protein